MRSRVALTLLTLAALAGCSRCGTKTTKDAGPESETPLLPDPTPAPDLWSFAKLLKAPEVSAPSQCKPRGPLEVAKVARTTRFSAERSSLATLIVGEHPSERLRASGIMTLVPDAKASGSAFVPWFPNGAFPRLARVSENGGWIAAVDRPGRGGMTRVALVRGDPFGDAAPSSAASLGEGDGFEAIDLDCDGGRCALLTSRLARVASAGAMVWTGAANEPASAWKSIEIAAPEGESEAHGVAVARAPSPVHGAIVVDDEKQHLAFYDVGGPTPREVARLAAPNGALDAIAIGDPPVALALTLGDSTDDDGCSKGTAGKSSVRIERSGHQAAVLELPAPALGGYLRPLAHGAIATFLAPLGCGEMRRIVYAVVLDATGAPTGPPMAVGDAASYAVAARGDDVDLWIQNHSEVTWMRLTCAP